MNSELITNGGASHDINHHEHSDDINKELLHGADVVRWVNFLTSEPSTSLLLAAQLHDWERVVNPGSTSGFVGDRSSPEYLEHKKNHASRSAVLVEDMLRVNNFSKEICEEVAFLILHHDDTGEEVSKIGGEELQILVSADSLSYFSQILPDMISRGVLEDQIRKKMKFMIGKMDDKARQVLSNWSSPDTIADQWKKEELAKF